MSIDFDELRAALVADELDALIVEGPANLRYLSGYSGSNGIAVVGVDGSARFYTDFRYETQIAQELRGEFSPEVVGGDLLEAAAGALPGGRIGFDDALMSVRRRRALGEMVSSAVELVPAGGMIERLRLVKSEQEIERIAAAAALIDDVLAWLVEQPIAGRSEREIAAAIEYQMRLRGASAASFPSIVAAGPAAALPHAQPRDAPVPTGTLMIVDCGALLDGYCSDCTRTFAIGEPGERAREVYAVVLAAQLAGVAALAAGAGCRDVDARARAVIDRAGYGERFGHGLGHGVGLEIHEAPRLARNAPEEPLSAGNVVTIEPGIYLPGELGVRIEDLVVVRENGARILSRHTKELQILA